MIMKSVLVSGIGNESTKRRVYQKTPLDSWKGCAREVDLEHMCIVIKGEITDWGKVEQFRILYVRCLKHLLGLSQL